jgi:hypothetical protein
MAATDPVSSEADLDEAFEASPEFGIGYLHSEFRDRPETHQAVRLGVLRLP